MELIASQIMSSLEVRICLDYADAGRANPSANQIIGGRFARPQFARALAKKTTRAQACGVGMPTIDVDPNVLGGPSE